MGWRYEVIILGGMTLFIFFLRYFVFSFHESPKFLLGKGKEQEAIDVLHKIAKFNRAPPPTLTVEHFREIDAQDGTYGSSAESHPHQSFAHVLRNFFASFKHLKGLFLNKLQLFIFILLAIAYMVCRSLPVSNYELMLTLGRATTGRSTWLARSCRSCFSDITRPLAKARSRTRTATTCTSIFPACSAQCSRCSRSSSRSSVASGRWSSRPPFRDSPWRCTRRCTRLAATSV
jgi:hypothetical protein